MLGLNHEFESLCFARGSFYLYLFTIMSQYLICKGDNNFLPDKGTEAFPMLGDFLLGVYF